ncbi:MAG TPA: NYN domain-containing protein [Parachlamydiaceae bacterium]|nr:NYN domain-containing protein [Parachlamydiaceae bacterium]
MHYYIDGYNLLFRILRSGDDVRKQREDITLEIEKKVNLLELDATLVFDSHYQEGDSEKSHFKSLEIVFTAKGETADEFILQELKESSAPAKHTVVTSDKKLARLCQLRLAKTESVDEFLAWLGRRYKNKLRQKRILASAPPAPKIEPEPKKPEPILPPTLEDSAEKCFSYYLDTFEKEAHKFEKAIPPPKPPQPPKKVKVKKRQLTKEEAELSDAQRWQQAFESRKVDDSDNFVF